MAAETKTHSAKRIILRVLIVAAALVLLAFAAMTFNWVNNTYIAFNDPVFTGSEIKSGQSLEEADKLTDSDKLMVKKILDEKGIPYKEKFGTTIFVRYDKDNKAIAALLDSGYEFDGYILG